MNRTSRNAWLGGLMLATATLAPAQPGGGGAVPPVEDEPSPAAIDPFAIAPPAPAGGEETEQTVPSTPPTFQPLAVETSVDAAIVPSTEGVTISRVLEARQQLGLSPAQVRLLQESQYELERRAIQVQADRQLAELELRRLMTEVAPPDRDAIMAQVDRLGQLRTEEQKLQIEQWLTLHDVLDSRQMAQVDRMFERIQTLQRLSQSLAQGTPPYRRDQSLTENRQEMLSGDRPRINRARLRETRFPSQTSIPERSRR